MVLYNWIMMEFDLGRKFSCKTIVKNDHAEQTLFLLGFIYEAFFVELGQLKHISKKYVSLFGCVCFLQDLYGFFGLSSDKDQL